VRIDALSDELASARRSVVDKEVVAVRPARPNDANRINAYIRGLSFASRYTRFLGPLNELTPAELHRMTHGNAVAPAALIVESGDQNVRTVIGEARYVLDGIAGEFALSVSDAWRGKGVGTLLMGIIEQRATLGGAHYLVGDVLRSNQPMLALARKLGFTVTRPVLDDRMFKVTKRLSRLDPAQTANEVSRRIGGSLNAPQTCARHSVSILQSSSSMISSQ
jgi:acetyltransferase